MTNKSFTRVLALDLHPRRFGYVVVESPDRLLDWGVRSYRREGNPRDALIHRRLKPLIEMWKPKFLVIRGARTAPPKQRLMRQRFIKRVAAEAKKYRVCVRMGSGQLENLTKYENARRIAEHFPALKGRLPPKRKAWESEHYRMSIFTAAALAIAQTLNESAAGWGSPNPPRAVA